MTELLEQRSNAASGEEDILPLLNEIRTFPRLTVEEETDLARRCAAGDEDAIRQMVNSNLRLVVSVAREYAGRGMPLLDLIQEGSIGLLAAARKFDYTRNYRFSTYATKWIRQGVTRCLLNHSGSIRVPIHTAEKMRRLAAARTYLRTQTGEEPTISAISENTGIPESKVTELLQLIPDICSLDVPVGEEERTTLADLLEDLEALQPQEALVRKELESSIRTLLSTLNERQQLILRLHFGMEDGTVHSLDEIGKMLGISKERVRQIERQSIDKLQAMGTSMGLEDFLE